MNHLRRRIKLLTWLFIIGLVISGLTAIPLSLEVDTLCKVFGVAITGQQQPGSVAQWLLDVQEALHGTSVRYPFLYYGTDWLAFGHFAIAIAFIGALRDPVRNRWLFTFGMICCVLVIPYAFFFGAIRGIPIWWRLIDSSFGVFGIIPLFLCRRWARQLEAETDNQATPSSLNVV